MSVFRIGAGFCGAPSLQTSVLGKEIVPAGKRFYKFSFINDQDCTIKINGGDPIFLRAAQGFDSGKVDVLIRSFVIVEASVTYNFIGAYQ